MLQRFRITFQHENAHEALTGDGIARINRLSLEFDIQIFSVAVQLLADVWVLSAERNSSIPKLSLQIAHSNQPGSHAGFRSG